MNAYSRVRHFFYRPGLLKKLCVVTNIAFIVIIIITVIAIVVNIVVMSAS